MSDHNVNPMPAEPAGLTPVPVTVWPAPFAGCTPAEALTAAVARAAATFTRVGQVVIDLHPTPARLTAITQARRRVIAVAGNAVEARTLADATAHLRVRAKRGDRRIRIWVSNDPAIRLAAAPGSAGLILATAADPDALPAGVRAWATSMRRALRPGGRLAVISAGSDASRPIRLIDTALTGGFNYTQHIAQLTAPIHGPRGGAPPIPTETGPRRGDSAVHPHIHAHLYLFQAHQGGAG